jgi:hypothetical protein
VTVNVADPLTLPFVAVMVVVPWLTAVTNPPADIVAIAVLDDVQVAVLVRFWVPPLPLKVPVAVNWSVALVSIDKLGAVTWIDLSVGVPPPPPPALPELVPPQAVSTARTRSGIDRESFFINTSLRKSTSAYFNGWLLHAYVSMQEDAPTKIGHNHPRWSGLRWMEHGDVQSSLSF